MFIYLIVFALNPFARVGDIAIVNSFVNSPAISLLLSLVAGAFIGLTVDVIRMWPSKIPFTIAVIFGGLHIVIIAIDLISGGAESIGFSTLVDFPILLVIAPLMNSRILSIEVGWLIQTAFGTIMYIFAGALIGLLINKLSRRTA